jgi:UTP--glucose-1-phosphate uridylyltransferase
MNSFNTDIETTRIVKKYTNQDLNILTFNQSRFPRIGKESLSPMPDGPVGRTQDWLS